MSERYTHRNGETTLPTVEGLYWMRDHPAGGAVVAVAWQEEIPADDLYEGYPAHFEVYFIGTEVDMNLDEFAEHKQWYGPLVPPWEDPYRAGE